MYIFSRIVMHQVSCRSVYIALSMTSVHCENSRLCVGRSCMWCGWTSKGAGPKSSSAATGCLGQESVPDASDACQPGTMVQPPHQWEVAASIARVIIALVT